MVLFGGRDAVSAVTDSVFEFDGVTWSETTPNDARPSARANAVMAYDAARGRSVMLGGDGLEGDAWEYHAEPDARPGHVARFDVSQAGLEPGASVSELQLFVRAGGTDGAGQDGVRLFFYRRGYFEPVAGADAGVSALAPLTWSAPAGFLSGLGSAARPDVTVAPTPVGGNGTGFGAVATDVVELRLRYRRP